jgi:geranylgeranyl pyrophosphate synthase
MDKEKKLALQARDLMIKRGAKGLEVARQIMKKEEIPSEPLKSAVDYFMVNWDDVVHPALLSLSCEAVGGNPETALDVAVAFVFLAGGADLHDDIIDESKVKDSKPTVYGKFGKELTVLAGDALLFKGLYTLHEACNKLPKEQKESILQLTKQAFYGISSAEAQETRLRKKVDVAKEYLDMIKTKSAVSEATTKIGATLGNGTAEEISLLGDFGKNFGVLFALRDEFIDILDFKEFASRRETECLPLPIQFALRNQEKRDEISRLIGKVKLTKKDAEKLYDLVVDLPQNVKLREEMFEMVKTLVLKINHSKLRQKTCFKMLLNSMIEDV